MRIVLLSPNSIGDIICSLIVGNACSAVADVSYIVPEYAMGLFKGTRFREYTRPNLPSGTFDLLVDLASTKRSRHLVRQISAREKVGRANGRLQQVWCRSLYHTLVEKHPAKHIVYDYKPILDYLGLLPASTIYLSHRADSLPTDRKEVCIHIGARDKVRYLPVDLIVQICRYFSDRRIPVRLIGTERERAEEIRSRTVGFQPTWEQGDLSVVKKWLSNALLTIAPDSGIFHLASALGCKTLGIYGSKPYSRTGSINPNATAVEGNCACQRQKRSIRSPYRDIDCRMGSDSRCLREIPFAVVQHKIETLLQS